MKYLIKYEDGSYSKGLGFITGWRDATRYTTRQEAEAALEEVMGDEVVSDVPPTMLDVVELYEEALAQALKYLPLDCVPMARQARAARAALEKPNDGS